MKLLLLDYWNHLTVCKQMTSASVKNANHNRFSYKSYIFKI